MVPMPKTQVATQVQDFHVLPVRFAALPSFPRETTHYLYVRANAPRVPGEDTPRELFLANVPIDATEEHIKDIFVDQLSGGRIEAVDFEDSRIGKGIKAPPDSRKTNKRKRGIENTAGIGESEEVGLLPSVWDRTLHRSGSTAIVRFVDRASAELSLREVRRAAKARKRVSWPTISHLPPLGSTRYLAHHHNLYPDPSVLQTSVDTFMTAFNARETSSREALARKRSEPDEDGFITVTRGGRNGVASEDAARLKEEELKKRNDSRTGGQFYRFQVREKAKERERGLVRGFEEDGMRLEEMRRRRGKGG